MILNLDLLPTQDHSSSVFSKLSSYIVNFGNANISSVDINIAEVLLFFFCFFCLINAAFD